MRQADISTTLKYGQSSMENQRNGEQNGSPGDSDPTFAEVKSEPGAKAPGFRWDWFLGIARKWLRGLDLNTRPPSGR